MIYVTVQYLKTGDLTWKISCEDPHEGLRREFESLERICKEFEASPVELLQTTLKYSLIQWAQETFPTEVVELTLGYLRTFTITQTIVPRRRTRFERIA